VGGGVGGRWGQGFPKKEVTLNHKRGVMNPTSKKAERGSPSVVQTRIQKKKRKKNRKTQVGRGRPGSEVQLAGRKKKKHGDTFL